MKFQYKLKCDLFLNGVVTDHPIILFRKCIFHLLSKFYKNMKNPDKKAVAKSFGIGYTYFESWLESISYAILKKEWR